MTWKNFFFIYINGTKLHYVLIVFNKIKNQVLNGPRILACINYKATTSATAQTHRHKKKNLTISN